MRTILNKTKILILIAISFFAILAGMISMNVFHAFVFAETQTEEINLTMNDGVALKINADGGLRFRVRMNETSYTAIMNDENLKLSVIITPEEFFNKVTDGNYYKTLNQGKRSKIVEIKKASIYQDGEVYYGNACIIKIAENHYSMNYKAIAVLTDANDAVVKYAAFNPEYVKGNLYDVLNSAVLDPENNNVSEIMALSVYSGWYGKGEYPVFIGTQEKYNAFVSAVNDGKYGNFDFSGITVKTALEVDASVKPSADKFKGEIIANYTVTIKANNDAYGSVDKTSLKVSTGAAISADGNVLTVGDIKVTATPAENEGAYTYRFNGWSVSDGSVSSDVEITAEFVRYEKLSAPSFTIENTVINLAYNEGGDGYHISIKDGDGVDLCEEFNRWNDKTGETFNAVNPVDIAEKLSGIEWTVVYVSVYSNGKESEFTADSDAVAFNIYNDVSALNNGILSWTDIDGATYDLYVNGEKKISAAAGHSVKVDTYANPAEVYAVIKYSAAGENNAILTTAKKLWSSYGATQLINGFENGTSGVSAQKPSGGFTLSEGAIAHTGNKSLKISTANTGAYSSDNWLFINFPGMGTATKVTLSMWVYVESIKDKDGNDLGWSDIIYSAVGYPETSRYQVRYSTTGYLQVGAWSRLDLTFSKDEGEINPYNGAVLRQNSELWYNSNGDSNESGNKTITYYIDDICMLETNDLKVNCTFSKKQMASFKDGEFFTSTAIENGEGINDGIDANSAKMYPGAHGASSQYNRNDVDCGNVKDKDGNAYPARVYSILNIYNDGTYGFAENKSLLKPRYAAGNGTSAKAILSKCVVRFRVKKLSGVSSIAFIVDKDDGNGFVYLEENVVQLTDEWQLVEFDCSKLGYEIKRLVIGTLDGDPGLGKTLLMDGFELAIR